jgi:hypothetical protein
MNRLFSFLLIVITIVGCGSSPIESQNQQQEVESATPNFEAADALVADITPFVRWTPGDTNIVFDETAARAAGLPEERIELGVALTEVSSNAANYLADPENQANLQATPSLRTQEAGVAIGFSWLPAVATATLQGYYVALGDTCPVPRFPAPITSYVSQAVAISRLTNAGFRYTLSPTGACSVGGSSAYGQFGTDYTKPLWYSVYGSASVPCYRYQGVVSASPPWTFQVQGAAPGGTTGTREPSPEICEYTWPNWWWPAYAAYFHLVKC